MAVWILCPLPMAFCVAELLLRYGRYRSFSRLVMLFTELQAVLCTSPLPAEPLFREVALRGLARKEAGLIADSLCDGDDFTSAWEKMLISLQYISQRDRLWISRYACVFGGSSIEEQIRLCERYAEDLRMRCEEEKKKLSEGRKLYLTVGAAGSALVLLMIK